MEGKLGSQRDCGPSQTENKMIPKLIQKQWKTAILHHEGAGLKTWHHSADVNAGGGACAGEAGALGDSVGAFANNGDDHTINFLTFITSRAACGRCWM